MENKEEANKNDVSDVITDNSYKKLEISSRELDKKLDKEIDKNYNKRVESYYEALKVLGGKYPEMAKDVSNKDIEKMASYQDEDIKNRLEIRALRKERNKILSEERKNLEKQLNKQLMKEFNSSEVFSTALTKGIMIGLLGPLAIGFVAMRQMIDVNQAKKEIKQELLESLDTGEEIDVRKTVSTLNHKMGSLYNLDSFFENIQKSDEFKEIKDNKSEKEKLLKSINEIQRESCDLFCELEEFVEEQEEERIRKMEREDEEEPGIKII